MSILLGNLSVKQIEERLGVELNDNEREFLNSTRQDRASNIAKNKWHCFDIPFNLVCGSMEFAKKVYEVFKPYSDKMVTRLPILIDELEEEE